MKHTTCISIGLFLIPVVLVCWGTARSQECSQNKDCQNINGSICDSGNCTCPESIPILVIAKDNASYCLQALNLTQGNCSFNQQCNYEHGMCQKDKTCGCEVKFVEYEEKCVKDEVKSVVPIAVGITIGVAVFGTLCLYLYLSRKKE